jgi:hypothetical protein
MQQLTTINNASMCAEPAVGRTPPGVHTQDGRAWRRSGLRDRNLRPPTRTAHGRGSAWRANSPPSSQPGTVRKFSAEHPHPSWPTPRPAVRTSIHRLLGTYLALKQAACQTRGARRRGLLRESAALSRRLHGLPRFARQVVALHGRPDQLRAECEVPS